MEAPTENVGETCACARKEAFPFGRLNSEVVSFADNQCLLELTHQGPVGDGGESKWMPTSKKVYWPPTATVAAAAHNGGHQPNQPIQPLPGAKSEAGSVISAQSGKRKKVHSI